ncbi:glyoxylase-like metal-dependent hydrolase (beta-lactamase superfamily II) [Actinoplanes octamycinicus]|uniref:Glyoxylase-like metal-dependent hydrolase (Beta-lactamase superfamily II) n=1 Tax=Actinoplanes octamycinicus TaxID=135948 RepID=A0A7W7M7H7_9ACTN|nr:MBL fold metallo-hydrolase [Actinoplanes octamycinicus]MBB4739907.1 glyoxylase-like metal-dependent hydrolase (beta-lactamase superfamily II) [Actinoplanes octamycinicus]GIE55093.1 hydrolase [Actinoplanes octamycinicus]
MTTEYTGEAPGTRDLGGGLTLTKVSVGPMDNNAYLLTAGPEQLLIDAANDAPELLKLIGDGGLATVVTTHRHRDHWFALAEVVEATGAASLAHEADAGELPVVTRTLRDGDTVTVGGHTLEVIHVVGHTPGSIVLAYREPDGGRAHLFTGDSLFPGGVGNTRGVKEHFDSLINDVERKLFDRFPDDTWFYPGHGKDSTLGAERPHLAEWRDRGW